MVRVYTEKLSRVYSANIVSCATLFCVCVCIIAVVLPFIVAYVTNNLWLKYSTYYEQPLALFTGEVIMQALAKDTYTIKTYSTIRSVQEIYSSTMLPATIKYNGPKIGNTFQYHNFDISFPYTPSNLRRLSVAIGFNYSLSQRVKLTMQSPLIFDIDLPNGAAKINVDGDLSLRQRVPLPVLLSSLNHYNYSLFSIPSTSNIMEMQKSVMNRNYSSKFDGSISTYIVGNDWVNINIKLKIPDQKILYTCSIWELLKFSWIQYFYLAFPSFLLAYYFALTVFKTSIIPTKVMHSK